MIGIRAVTIESAGGADTSSINMTNRGNSSDTIIAITASNFGNISHAEMTPDPALIPANTEKVITFDAAALGVKASDAGKTITVTIRMKSGDAFTISTVISPRF